MACSCPCFKSIQKKNEEKLIYEGLHNLFRKKFRKSSTVVCVCVLKSSCSSFELGRKKMALIPIRHWFFATAIAFTLISPLIGKMSPLSKNNFAVQPTPLLVWNSADAIPYSSKKPIFDFYFPHGILSSLHTHPFTENIWRFIFPKLTIQTYPNIFIFFVCLK